MHGNTKIKSTLILSSHLRLGLPSGLFPSGFPTKTMYTLSSPSYALYTPPLSFFSILPPGQYWVSSTKTFNQSRKPDCADCCFVIRIVPTCWPQRDLRGSFLMLWLCPLARSSCDPTGQSVVKLHVVTKWKGELNGVGLPLYIGLFISPSGISELDCATTKTDTAERSISIGRESLQVFFLY